MHHCQIHCLTFFGSCWCHTGEASSSIDVQEPGGRRDWPCLWATGLAIVSLAGISSALLGVGQSVSRVALPCQPQHTAAIWPRVDTGPFVKFREGWLEWPQMPWCQKISMYWNAIGRAKTLALQPECFGVLAEMHVWILMKSHWWRSKWAYQLLPQAKDGDCKNATDAQCWITSCQHVLCDEHARLAFANGDSCPIWGYDGAKVMRVSREGRDQARKGLLPGESWCFSCMLCNYLLCLYLILVVLSSSLCVATHWCSRRSCGTGLTPSEIMDSAARNIEFWVTWLQPA